MAITLQLFLHEMLFDFLTGIFVKDALIKFLPKTLSWETRCKLVQNFPPKVLVYIWKIFLDAFQIYLIENYLTNQLVMKENSKQIKYLIEYETCGLLSTYVGQ